jgi:DNA-directed RNA polymerase subunit RPC12/RpoP
MHAEDTSMAEKRTWVCLSCGSGYEVHADVLPLRCWDCRARLVEMPLLALERREATRRHPSSSTSS